MDGFKAVPPSQSIEKKIFYPALANERNVSIDYEVPGGIRNNTGYHEGTA
jgi:hypothetical protein